MRTPMELWLQAEQEHPIDGDGRRRRYIDLMRAEGHIVKRKPGDEPALPCGWDPTKGIDQLLTDDERKKLNADLSEMARQRRRSEASARDIPLP